MSRVKGLGDKKNVAVNKTTGKVEKNTTVDCSPRIAEDRLSVSHSAQQIDDLFQQLADLEEVNTVRVRRVRESIKTGNFPIDYQLLAEKIQVLSDELNADNDD